MDNIEQLTLFENNTIFNTFCPNNDYNNGLNDSYFEPFNNNFTSTSLFLYSDPLFFSEEPSNLLLNSFELSNTSKPLELSFEQDDSDFLLPTEPSNSNYQYNLAVNDSFDNWSSVDTFMYQYCLERGFGYQISRNDKDPNDSTITRRKSFRCSSNGNYKARKIIDQKLHCLHGTIKTDCE